MDWFNWMLHRSSPYRFARSVKVPHQCQHPSVPARLLYYYHRRRVKSSTVPITYIIDITTRYAKSWCHSFKPLNECFNPCDSRGPEDGFTECITWTGHWFVAVGRGRTSIECLWWSTRLLQVYKSRFCDLWQTSWDWHSQVFRLVIILAAGHRPDKVIF